MTDPSWLTYARTLLGTRETPGIANNPVIIAWAKRLGVKALGMVYSQDATPWCGLYCAHVMKTVGIDPPPIAVRAKAWATWGVPTVPRVGAVLVFAREGGGHVGFYSGEDATHFYVLGGNQGDRVCTTRIAKNRKVACRWPAGVQVTTKPLQMAAAGVAVSRSEA